MGELLCINCGFTKGDSTCGRKICPNCGTLLIVKHNNKINGFCGKCSKSIFIEEVITSKGNTQRYKCSKQNKIYSKPLTICEAL